MGKPEGNRVGNCLLLPGILCLPYYDSVVKALLGRRGQAVLGGLALSFYFGISFGIAAGAGYFLPALLAEQRTLCWVAILYDLGGVTGDYAAIWRFRSPRKEPSF